MAKRKDKEMYIVGIAVVILILIIIAIVVSKRRHNRENYRKCICSSDQGGRQENCQDGDVVDKLYEDNILTESTNLRSKGWSTVSPGDVDFPVDIGCGEPIMRTQKTWAFWDYDML